MVIVSLLVQTITVSLPIVLVVHTASAALTKRVSSRNTQERNTLEFRPAANTFALRFLWRKTENGEVNLHFVCGLIFKFNCPDYAGLA